MLMFYLLTWFCSLHFIVFNSPVPLINLLSHQINKHKSISNQKWKTPCQLLCQNKMARQDACRQSTRKTIHNIRAVLVTAMSKIRDTPFSEKGCHMIHAFCVEDRTLKIDYSRETRPDIQGYRFNTYER
jgi:hypothetical protein